MRLLPLISLLISLQADANWFDTCSLAQRSSIIWSDDVEHGIGSLVWPSGKYAYGTSKYFVHSGSYAEYATIWTKNGESGVRFAKKGPFPDEAWYSRWVYLPYGLTSEYWFNLMQWKSEYWTHKPYSVDSHPVVSVNIVQSGGQMRLAVFGYAGEGDVYNGAGRGFKAYSGAVLPIGKWFHLECLYHWATNKGGSITVYQDGQSVMHVSKLTTELPHEPTVYNRQWSLDAYGDLLRTSKGKVGDPFTLYTDDGAISLLQLWH